MTITIPHRPCPNCGARSAKKILEWSGFNQYEIWGNAPDSLKLEIARCKDCGMVYAINSDEVDMSNDKFIHHRPAKEPVPAPSPRLDYHRAQLNMLKPYIPAGARVLDYGAGFCNFLRAARERGYEVEGINPIRYAAEWAGRVLDIEVHPVFGMDFETDKRYDLIVSDMTFEHLVNPRGNFAKIRNLLAVDGVAYIEVPNWHTIKRLRRGVDCLKDPTHYNYFTPTTLADMAQREGFQVIRKAPTVGRSPARKILKSIVNALGIGTCSVLLKR